jgi:predicted O-methyltransferase YrrM
VPLARTYDASIGRVVTTAYDGYVDRLSRWSDIREYLPFLYETAKQYPEVRVLEFGARKGNSTLAFLAAAEAAGGHVLSVDIEPVADDAEGMRPWRRHPRWKFIHGDDTQEVVHRQLPRWVDVLFIDTSHEYEHTLYELHQFMPLVTPGGIALFHDTNLYMRTGGKLDEFPQVSRALDEYCGQTGESWENIPGEYGMGIIRK